MDESAPIRAIVIGVSTLIAVATISAVLMYYNTAKQMASNIGTGQDFAANYEDSIKQILVNGLSNVSGTNYITGTDVKNLLNYFYNDETVEINVRNIIKLSDYNIGNHKPTIDNSVANFYLKANIDDDNGKFGMLQNSILEKQKFKLERTNDGSVMKLEITGQM